MLYRRPLLKNAPGRGYIPTLPSAEAGTRFSDPAARMQGWVNLVGWLHTEIIHLSVDGHTSQTAPRRVTSLIHRTTRNAHRYPLKHTQWVRHTAIGDHNSATLVHTVCQWHRPRCWCRVCRWSTRWCWQWRSRSTASLTSSSTPDCGPLTRRWSLRSTCCRWRSSRRPPPSGSRCSSHSTATSPSASRSRQHDSAPSYRCDTKGLFTAH